VAFVDKSTGKIVVRVVYDGPALAGKTTNVEQLCEAFKGRSQSPVISPEQQGERTRFLDWLKVDTGLVSGRQLSCHFITVPGQRVLSRRRDLLLRLADAVVFVCSADPDELKTNLACYNSLKGALQNLERVPLVFQLNKLDHPRAVSEQRIRSELGLAEDFRIVRARAHAGDGVRETAVLALRAAADRVQSKVLERGFDSIDDPPGDAYELAAMIRKAESQDQRSLVEVVLDARPLETKEPEPEAESRELPISIGPPPLPNPAAASGMIWPANDGRELLRRALHQTPYPIEAPEEVDEWQFEAGMWALSSSKQLSYPDLESAREALLRAVRRSLALGDLAVPHLTLCLCRDKRQKYFLWRVGPRLSTLDECLEYGCRAGDADYVTERLTAFARGTAQIQSLERRLETSLSCRLSDFGMIGQRVYYLRHGNESSSGEGATALSEPLRRFELPSASVEAYREIIGREFSEETWAEVYAQRHRTQETGETLRAVYMTS
jgi:signal recognition particle receptor subunit beta